MISRLRLFAVLLLAGLLCVSYGRAQFIGEGVWKSVAGGCSQATSFLARTSGLNGAHTSAYTTFICGAVTDGWWSKMDAVYIWRTQDRTTAKLNLVSSSFTGTEVGTPTSWAADVGYTGDASTFAFDTGFTPSSAGGNYALNAANVGVCIASSRTSDQGWDSVGVQNVAATAQIESQTKNAGADFISINDLSGSSTTVSNAQGLWQLVRTGASAGEIYVNGSAFQSYSATSVALPDRSVYFFARNISSVNRATGDLQTMGFIGGSLTATDASNIAIRASAWNTTFGGGQC